MEKQLAFIPLFRLRAARLLRTSPVCGENAGMSTNDRSEPLRLTCAQCRAVDKYAIEVLGIPGVVLMENAGRNATDLIEQWMRASGCRAGPGQDRDSLRPGQQRRRRLRGGPPPGASRP